VIASLGELYGKVLQLIGVLAGSLDATEVSRQPRRLHPPLLCLVHLVVCPSDEKAHLLSAVANPPFQASTTASQDNLASKRLMVGT